MKARLLIIVGLMIMAVALTVAPVMALSTGTTSITGNPQSYVSITLSNTSVYLPLDPSNSPATNSSMGITVLTNIPFSITVADMTGRSTGQGFLGNYTSGVYDASPLNTDLGSPIQLTGTTNTTTTADSITPPITTGSPQTFFTGSSYVTNQVLATEFTRPVAYTDRCYHWIPRIELI